jgi:hypothetical protein
MFLNMKIDKTLNIDILYAFMTKKFFSNFNLELQS